METNNIFSFRRFGKYLVSDLKRCIANFGLSFLVISLTGLVCYLLVGVISYVSGAGWVSSNALARSLYLWIAFAILVVAMPNKCYGFITDRKLGSNWLMLPVSTVEKFLSMLINCLVIIPSAFFLCSFAIDWLITAIDPQLHSTIIVSGMELFDVIVAKASAESEVNALLTNFITENNIIFSAIDDSMILILAFLLGAILFKSQKATKTILAWFGIGTLLSIILTPVAIMLVGNFDLDTLNALNNGDIETVTTFAQDFISSAMKFDTIFDVTLLLGMEAAIFMRLKTIKH